MTESEFEAQDAEARRAYHDRVIKSYEDGCREIEALHAQAKRSIAVLDRMRRRLHFWTGVLIVSSAVQIGLTIARLVDWF